MTSSSDCFFGEKVTKDVSRKVNVVPGMMLHLSHAALDHMSEGKPPVSLSVNNGQDDFLICTLRDCGHTPLDLNFSNPITLKVKGGTSAIHVTGYWEVMGDPEMDFEEDEEEEEEEEVAPAAAAAPATTKTSPKTKPSPKASPKASPKQAAEVVSTKEEAPAKKQTLAQSMGLPEDIADDESISSSLLREMMEGMEEMEEFEEDDEEGEEEPAQPVGQKRAAPAPVAVQSQPPQKKAKGAQGAPKQPAQQQKQAAKPAAKPQAKPAQQAPPQGGKKGKKGKKN